MVTDGNLCTSRAIRRRRRPLEHEELKQLIEDADRLYQQGQLDDALDKYSEAIEHDPESAWAYNRIGAILAQTGNTEHAEEALNRALALDPKLAQAHSNLGNLHYARGDYEAALAKYQEAVALDPANAVFHENTHAAYKKLRRFSEAVAALKQAHRIGREGVKAEAKAKLDHVKQGVKGRTGCFGSVLVLLIPVVLGLLLI